MKAAPDPHGAVERRTVPISPWHGKLGKGDNEYVYLLEIYLGYYLAPAHLDHLIIQKS